MSPLYRLYNIRVDWTQFEQDAAEGEPQELEEIDSANDCELLLGSQHTIVWSEDKYLEIAFGNACPLSIISDEHAEELLPEIIGELTN